MDTNFNSITHDDIDIRILNTIIKLSPEPISISDKNGICIIANKAYHKLVGAEEGEIEGKRLSELVDGKLIFPSAGLIAQSKNYNSGYMLQYLPRVGKEVLVTGFSISNSRGEIEFLVGTGLDLDELNSIRYKLKKMSISGIGANRGLDELNNLTHQLKQNKIVSNFYCIAYDKLGNSYFSKKDLVFKSDIMKQIMDKVDRVAKSDVPVLITGETGTGKEIIAKMIHAKSLRSNAPYITINCASVPENLVESELFGYTDGAFTGAAKHGRQGLIEMADSGTFLLDEVAELPLNIQAKLLRVLEDMEIRQLGSNKSKSVDVRIIAATNKNLTEEIQNGRFREDLFYRLSVVPLELPPLRKRKGEIVPLTDVYLSEANKKYNYQKKISSSVYGALERYHWPGNIRELKNLISNLVICSEQSLIDIEDLPSNFASCMPNGADNNNTKENFNLKHFIGDIERQYLFNALKEHGSTRMAAESLGLSQTTFLRKLNSYKLKAPQ